MQGPQTELLQLALVRAGHKISVDGIFGAKTKKALVSFQDSSGLSADGIAGEKTWGALMPYLTGYRRVRVESGDTFYKLAKRYGTTAEAVEAANPTADPLNLRIGSELTVPLGFPVVPTNVSFTYTALMLCVEGLTSRYPFISTGEIGKSSMGKPIPYLAAGRGEREVMYNACHHANEWITTPLVLKYLEEYSSSLVSGGSVGGIPAMELFNSARLYIVPMVDPDGADLVTGELDSGVYFDRAVEISKKYSDIPFPLGWKANIDGVDINLQYPANWEKAKEIKFSQGYTSPAPRDYVGTKPLSAPEARAMYFFTVAHDFSLTISYHAQGSVIYWKYLDMEPEGAKKIATKFSKLSGYALEDVPEGSAYAGYKDWFIQTYDRPGFTIEVGSGKTPLPLSQFPKIFEENAEIMSFAQQSST